VPAYAPLLLIAIAAAGLGRLPLWRDEVASVVAASRHTSALWGMVLHSSDASVGLYYFLLAPVVRISQEPWALRLPSLLGAVVTVAVTIDTARRLAGRWAGFLAGVLLAGNGALLALAGTARPYTLAMMAATCATRLLLITRPGRRRRAVGYGLWVLLGTYLHAMTALLFLAHALALVLFRRFAPIRRSFALALGAVAVAVVPLALLMRAQSVQTAWLPLVRSAGQVGEVAEQLAGGTSLAARAWAVAVVVGVVLALVLRPREAPVGPLAVMVALPPVVLIAVGAVTPILSSRYLVFVLPPLAVLAGLGWAAVARRVLVPAAVAMSAVAVAVTVGWFHGATSPDDPEAAAAYLAAHDAPGDAIVFSPVWARTEMHYFLERRDDVVAADVALRPDTVEADVGSLYLPEADAAEIRSALLGARRIWVVGFPGNPWRPTPDTSAEVYAALHRPGTVVLDRWFGDLDVRLVELDG
jgi:mannosyltransferase